MLISARGILDHITYRNEHFMWYSTIWRCQEVFCCSFSREELYFVALFQYQRHSQSHRWVELGNSWIQRTDVWKLVDFLPHYRDRLTKILQDKWLVRWWICFYHNNMTFLLIFCSSHNLFTSLYLLCGRNQRWKSSQCQWIHNLFDILWRVC